MSLIGPRPELLQYAEQYIQWSLKGRQSVALVYAEKISSETADVPEGNIGWMKQFFFKYADAKPASGRLAYQSGSSLLSWGLITIGPKKILRMWQATFVQMNLCPKRTKVHLNRSWNGCAA